MKKLLLFVFSAVFLLSITACSSENNNENVNQDNPAVENEDTDTNAEEPAEDEDNNATNNEQETEENTANSEEEESADTPNEIADFEEADQLAMTIDNLDSLTAEIETDNPNKRIILFADDNGQKKFKSIFIKEKQRLKIIELNKEGEPLYNDTI